MKKCSEVEVVDVLHGINRQGQPKATIKRPVSAASTAADRLVFVSAPPGVGETPACRLAENRPAVGGSLINVACLHDRSKWKQFC